MTLHTNLSFETATGSIDYPFTNDYMFLCYFTEGQAGAESIDCSFATPKKKVFTM